MTIYSVIIKLLQQVWKIKEIKKLFKENVDRIYDLTCEFQSTFSVIIKLLQQI